MSPRIPASAVLSLFLVAGCGDGTGEPPVDAANDPEQAESPSAAPDGPAEAGTIQATVDGEKRTWIALYIERDRGPQATSTVQSRTIGRMTNHSLSIGGHVAANMVADGSLRITVTTTEGFERCPCRFEGQTIGYVVDFPDDRLETNAATVSIESFAAAADGAYQATGSFSGVLSPTGEGAEAGSDLPVEGTFHVRRIVRMGEG